jgi:hypothetical protein
MNTDGGIELNMARKPPVSRRIWKAVVATGTVAAMQATSTGSTNSYSFNASLGLKESADSNVYLQSTTPLAIQESMVTSVLPQQDSLGSLWSP